MKRRIMVIVAVLVVALAGGGAWYYFAHRNATPANKTQTSETQTEPNGTSKPEVPMGTPSPSGPSGPSNNQTYQVSVYFSKHPQSDDDPSAVFPVSRTSPDLGVAIFSIKELLKGPTAGEAQQGYFTTAQLRNGTGTNDFTVTIKDSTATLQFLRQFDHRGVVADGQAESELNATLKQFSGVKKVVILNSSGNCEFNLSGQNKCLQ